MSTINVKLGIKTVTRVHTKETPVSSHSFQVNSIKHDLNTKLQKIQEGKYVPNQGYDYIRREGEKTILESITDITRRIHDTVNTTQPISYRDKERLASKIRERELKDLEEFALKNKILIDPTNFNNLYNTNPIHGGEHQVVILEGKNLVAKRRMLWATETYFDTLSRLAEHNKVFPESAYEFKGFMKDSKSSGNFESHTGLLPTYSQPFIRRLSPDTAKESLGFLKSEVPTHDQINDRYKSLKTKGGNEDYHAKLDAAHWLLTSPNPEEYAPVTLSETVAYMKSKGFEPQVQPELKSKINDDDPRAAMHHIQYVNKETGVTVSDLHIGNMIRSIHGDILTIDPQMDFNGKLQEDRIQEVLYSL